MKLPVLFRRLPLLFSIAVLVTTPLALHAGPDFPWVDELQVRAAADPGGFRAQLAARFHVTEPEVDAIIVAAPRPADAYLVFRLSELSGRPPLVIVERYKREPGAGWGVLAQNLGIKPGSDEFKALKRGHDLSARSNDGEGHGGDKAKGPDKGERGKGKGQGKDKD